MDIIDTSNEINQENKDEEKVEEEKTELLFYTINHFNLSGQVGIIVNNMTAKPISTKGR